MKKEFLLSILFTLSSIVLSLYYKNVVTGIFGKGELAVFFTALDIVGVFMLLFIGFRSSLSVAMARGADEADLLNIFRIAITAVAAVGSIIGYFILVTIYAPMSFWTVLWLFIAFGVYIYLSNQLTMYRLYRLINYSTVIEQLFAVAFFAAFYFVLGLHSFTMLFVSFVSSLLGVSLYIYLSKSGAHKEPSIYIPAMSETNKTFIKNSFFSSLEFVFGVLMIYFAVVAVTKYMSLEELGDFQVVVKAFFMYLITLFVFPIVRFFIPELSRMAVNKDMAAIDRLTRFSYIYALSVAVFCTLVFALFGKWLIGFLFGEAYLPAYIPFCILAPAIFFVTMNTYQISVLKAFNRFVISTSVRAVGSLSFVLYFAPFDALVGGLTGVSLTLLSAYATMFFVSMYFSTKEMKKLALKD